MKKMFKTMVSAVAAVTMLTGSAMPVFAEESTYDHEKAMEEFRVYINNNINKDYETINAFNNLANDSGNFCESYEGYYELTEEAKNNISDNSIIHDYNYFTKASDGRYYINRYSAEADGRLERFLNNFETKNIDGVNYVTLDGKDYSYCLDINVEGYDRLYVNYFPTGLSPELVCNWYVKKTEITDEMRELAENDTEWQNIIQLIEEHNNNCIPEYVYPEEYSKVSYLSDKLYEVMKLENCSFHYYYPYDFEKNGYDYGFETLEQLNKYLADYHALKIIAEVSKDDETIYERIKPFLNEYGYLNFDIDGDGEKSPSEIEFLKKYYDNELVNYDVDFDDELTVKDLASIKLYLINVTDFSPMQKIISQNEDKTIDIRTVTKAARKIVKLD